jgi:hypothetical protein
MRVSTTRRFVARGASASKTPPLPGSVRTIQSAKRALACTLANQYSSHGNVAAVGAGPVQGMSTASGGDAGAGWSGSGPLSSVLMNVTCFALYAFALPHVGVSPARAKTARPTRSARELRSMRRFGAG